MNSSFLLPDTKAEKIKTIPNVTATTLAETNPARYAPDIAPIVVAISRNIPILIFEMPFFTYDAAAPEEVAITDIREVPTAYFISTPNPSVNNGMIITPPPKPVNDPNRPAANELLKTIKVKSILLKSKF